MKTAKRLKEHMMNPTRIKMKSDRQGRGVSVLASIILLMVVCIGLTAVQLAQAAFPTVQATNTSASGRTKTHTVDLPASISSGDLLIVFFSCDGNESTVTWSEGFSSIFHQANGADNNTLDIGYKFADGTEAATTTVTTGSNEKSAHISYRITGHNSALAPQVSSGATGSSLYPNPDSLTPTGGAKDYFWIAVAGNDNGNQTASAYPRDYVDGQSNADGSSGGANVAVARRQRNASSEDPGTFTLSASVPWVACTVAVHPPSAATAVDLLSFSAKGDGAAVNVEWETAAEYDNLGFNLYRASAPDGPYERSFDRCTRRQSYPVVSGQQ